MATEGNEFVAASGRAETAGPGRIRWWQWPTILSLDAPVVAVLWQWMIAHAARVEPGGPQAWVLGASVWLAYAADRWIEAWRLHPDRIQTVRHRFYQGARWPVAAIWAAVFCADLFEAFARLSNPELLAGSLLLVPVLLYLLSHQFVHRHRRWRAPKELCVAALLGGGVAVFVLGRPGADRSSLALPLGLFVLLCFANCVLISGWEYEVDRSHGQTSLALKFRHAATLGRTLSWILAALSCLAALAIPDTGRTALGCAAVAAGLLGIVDLAEKRLGWQLARVLADVALMTPAIPLAAAWMR